jgi:hypothetical protein
MALVHAAMPSERWLLDLVISFAAGGVVYVVVLLSVGLPKSERASVLAMAGRVVGRAR